jgi:hypothetical protein
MIAPEIPPSTPRPIARIVAAPMRGTFHAACDCGWSGPARPLRDRRWLEADLNLHLHEQHDRGASP